MNTTPSNRFLAHMRAGKVENMRDEPVAQPAQRIEPKFVSGRSLAPPPRDPARPAG